MFGVFRPSHQGGGDLEMWMLQDTDLSEAAARYLRCLYETTPAQQRIHAVHQEYLALCPRLHGQPPMLRDIVGARRGSDRLTYGRG